MYIDNTYTEQFLFPAVSYHSISLCRKSNHEVPFVSGPAPIVYYLSELHTSRYFHSPKSLKATPVSRSFSPHIKIVFSSYAHFLFKIISNYLVISASFSTTTTASQTAFISPWTLRIHSVFTGLPNMLCYYNKLSAVGRVIFCKQTMICLKFINASSILTLWPKSIIKRSPLSNN